MTQPWGKIRACAAPRTGRVAGPGCGCWAKVGFYDYTLCVLEWCRLVLENGAGSCEINSACKSLILLALFEILRGGAESRKTRNLDEESVALPIEIAAPE